MELKLHNIHSGAIDSALQKAQQYRSLLEPEIAESICLDILNIDPDNQQAIVVYILALTDQLNQSERQSQIKEIERAIDKLVSEYQRYYYRGLFNERRARFMITQPMSRTFAYEYFYEALQSYKQAEEIRPGNNDEAVLRWNSCIRTIQNEKLKPRKDSEDILIDMES
jgi:tetratricopeptide (TPR) repeat protein